MTNKELVRRTLNHLESDICPYQVGLTTEAHEKMNVYYGNTEWSKKVGNQMTEVGRSPVPERAGSIAPDFYKDEFGAIWDRTRDKDIGTVSNHVITPQNLSEYVFPDPKDQRCYEDMRTVLAANSGQFILANVGFSFFERAWILRGMENLLMNFVDDAPFVNEFLDRIMYWILDVIEEYSKYPQIDAVHFGDDWGQQNGLIMGPGTWREFIKPRLARIYGEVKKSGKFVSIHCCGDIKEIIPDLIEIGLDLFNPFQPEVMDVNEMKRLYGDRLTFWGGISLQRTMAFGTPEDVRNETLDRIATIGKGGGYIAGPCHGIPRDVPAENIDMLIRTLREQGH